MSAETKVDVSGLLRDLPELLVIASTDPSSDRLIGVALRIRETESAVAELIEALRRAERKLAAYVGVCKGDKELTETVLPMVRAALARIGGAK